MVLSEGDVEKGSNVKIEVRPSKIPPLPDEAIAKIDLIIQRLSSSRHSGAIYQALSTASNTLRLNVDPSIQEINSLISENRDRITALENVMKQIFDKLNRL